MPVLNYDIKIDATVAVVWQIMLEQESYRRWVKAFSPNSRYEGTWTQGTTIRFYDPAMGGTDAVLEIVNPHWQILARHVAMVSQSGELDRSSEMAQRWIGTTEQYYFSESDGMTRLAIAIETANDFVEMFDSCWPQALKLLKNICEST